MASAPARAVPRLVLVLRGIDSLANGVPTRIELDQRGVVIGRSPTVEWSLPDPRSYVSSRHAEIVYGDGRYSLIDISTNGTYLNGATERSFEAQPLNDGDVILIGHYEIVCSLVGGAPAPVAAPPPAPTSAWGEWGASAAPPPAEPAGWGSPAPMSAISGQGPMSGNWAPPPAPGTPQPPASDGWSNPAPAAPASDGWGAPAPSGPASDGWGSPAPAAPASGGWGATPTPPAAPSAAAAPGWGAAEPAPAGNWGAAPASAAPPANANPSAWDQPAAAPGPSASGWSSAAPDRPAAPSADDVWGKIAATNVVDWARGGFGQATAAADPLAAPPPAPDPLGLARPAPSQALPTAVPAAPYAAPPAPTPPPVAGGAIDRFLAEAGVSRSALRHGDAEVLAAAGSLIRRVVAGLVVMMEARARAKAQMGAQATSLEFDGNNPLKFARSPEQAVAQLLNPQERGFMPADRAVEDAFHDLQSHQMATLKAMQGALKATLERFSPAAIRQRAETGGVLARILPGARDAALWQAYEREFGGVARGSDEAFMDVFAKEFKRAYEDSAARRPRS